MTMDLIYHNEKFIIVYDFLFMFAQIGGQSLQHSYLEELITI